MTTRDLSLDVAKGIGIILVVIGHVFPPKTAALIYVFHMPLFFFVGGILFKASTDPATYSIRKARQLLTPYVAFLLLFYSVQSMLVFSLSQQDTDLTLLTLLYGGERLTGWFSVFWFPTCYFFTVVLYAALQSRLSKAWLWRICFVMLATSYLAQTYAPDRSMPWALNVVLVSMPIFHLGHAFAKYYHKRPNWYRPVIGVAGVLGLTYLVAVWTLDAPTMAMKRADSGWPILTLLAGLSCVLVLLEVSRLLTRRVSTPSLILSRFGAASLTIMYVHQPVQIFLRQHVDLYNPVAVTIIALVSAYACHELFKLLSLSRTLFLGQFPRVSQI